MQIIEVVAIGSVRPSEQGIGEQVVYIGYRNGAETCILRQPFFK